MRIRRATGREELKLADRLARRCGPRNGKLPSASAEYGAAVWVVYGGGPDSTTFNLPTGFAVAYADKADGVLHLMSCGVLPAVRGRGLQRRLLSTRLAWGRRRGCTIARSYTSADAAYSLANLLRAGFVVTGFRADEHASGNGWVDVQRPL